MVDQKTNWMVIVTNKQNVELKGIYPTKRAAMFISQRVKFNDKLKYFPKVVPTTADLYPANNRVEEWLQHLDKQKQKAKYLTKVRHR